MRRSHILVIHALITATAATGLVMRTETVLADETAQPAASQKLKLKSGEEITVTHQNGRFLVHSTKGPVKDGKLTLSDDKQIRVRDGVLTKGSIDKLGLAQKVDLKIALEGHPNAVAVITKTSVHFEVPNPKPHPLPDGTYKFAGPKGKTFAIKNGQADAHAILLTIGSAQFEATKDQILVAASLPEAELAKLSPPVGTAQVDVVHLIDPDELHVPCNQFHAGGWDKSCFKCKDGLCSESCMRCDAYW